MAFENPADARTEQIKLYLNEYYKAKAKRLASARKKQLATFLYETLVKALEAIEQQEQTIDEKNAA